MKYLATAANFFFPGLGYLMLRHKIVQSLGWLAGVIGLTVVELQLQEPMPTLYWTMFASVLVMNTMFAVDAWKVASEQEAARVREPALA